MAQEPGEQDGKADPEVGVDGRGAGRQGHQQLNQAGTARHLPIAGSRRGQQDIREQVREGTRDVRANRRTARANERI